MKYLTGKDYPYLCEPCQSIISSVVLIVQQDEMYIDDEEGPCNFVYDQGWFCGGHTCINRPEKEFTPHE